jgi:hypothetical protein
MTETHWSSDVPVSLPEPLEQATKYEPRVPMGGFVFTVDGLFHDIDPVLHEELSLPTFTPQPASEVIYDDESDSLEFG